jgi:hypothetical protein
VEGLAADLAFLELRVVVGATHGTEDEVEDVLFLLRRRGLRLRLELRRTPGTFRISRGHESAAVRADEEEADLATLEHPVRVPIPQLGRVPEARLEQLQRVIPVEPEGPAEADDGLVHHEGPAGLALRLIRRDRLLADGTKDPGLFPGHRRGFHVLETHKVTPSSLRPDIRAKVALK